MNDKDQHQHRAILQNIAHRAMIERGLLPDFSTEVMAELNALQPDLPKNGGGNIRDLRDLLWSSIDNDDSLDLDQLTVAEALPDEKVKILVAVADVDVRVKQNGAIDGHAHHNTTSVYTAAMIFPMLPERLSTDLTSMNLDEERLSVVVEIVVALDGSVHESDVYRALVRNHAKLAYNSVAAWLDGLQAMPEAIARMPGLEAAIRLQDGAAQRMKDFRHTNGALSFDTVEAKPVFDGDTISALEAQEKNRAKQIVEDFMIAANGVTARYLAHKKFPSIRRVVRTPKRWERIVEIAGQYGVKLPFEPDSKALEVFLTQRKAADPLRFPDLSLSVIKLLGAGEYLADVPGDEPPGHFGLAVRDYAHSTAPNRRYTDLITQRLLKAAIDGKPSPYSVAELKSLAERCTAAEDSANKVERRVSKSAAALLLESHIGEQFDAIVTGAASKGTWVRLLAMPVEGRVVQGFEGVDVGDSIHVQLLSVDVEQGYIDFKRVAVPRH